MFFNYITIFIALAISGVAIFYSVAGLATIFAASVIPIIIMGSVLEVGKLITAVWLHRNWKKAVWWLKTYLTLAVVILMFITSMGIFGYLSKSHIEQATASDDQTAKIEVLDDSIVRLDTKIKRWDDEIARLSSGDISNTRVDNLIKREEDALAKINVTIEREKKQYRRQATSDINAINSKLAQYRETTKDEIVSINEQLKTCFSCSDEQQALKDAKGNLATKETKADNDIANIKRQLTKDINAVATRYDSQLSPINNRISELKTQSSTKTQDIDKRIAELETNINTAQIELSSKRDDKTVLESKFRKLEAEVGPVKYIAEFIYNKQADRTMLEEAVRWVIVTIIFVFDPLAVLLLIASQYSFEEHKRNNKPKPPTPPTSKPKKREHEYIELVGKTYNGKYNENDKEQPTNNTNSYKELIGKTFEGKHCKEDEENYSPRNKKLEQAVYDKVELISEIFKGAQHEEDVAEIKPPVKTKTVKKKKNTKPNKKAVKKVVQEIKPKKRGIIKAPIKSKVSNQDVDVITQLIESGSAEDYISHEGKKHRKPAFEIMHPEFITDVKSTVDFGVVFPENVSNATLFLRTDFLPTKLFRFNSESWVELDKALLKESAYSRKYISHLISKINEHDYDKVLLDAVVAEGVDDETVSVFNDVEIKHITEFKA
jgi:uncharacterized small protein (DUF1192 family)